MINIKDEVQKTLDAQQSTAEIVEIYATGSQLFRDNPGDLDYVVICRGYTPLRQKFISEIEGTIYDVVIYDEVAKWDQLVFANNLYTHRDLKLFNYFIHFRNTIYGKWEIDWNMLDYKQEYLNYIKNRYLSTTGKRQNRTKATKGFVHYYIILKIYKNNRIEITPEMLQDIQTLYNATDGSQIPITDWIEEQINNIKEVV